MLSYRTRNGGNADYTGFSRPTVGILFFQGLFRELGLQFSAMSLRKVNLFSRKKNPGIISRLDESDLILAVFISYFYVELWSERL